MVLGTTSSSAEEKTWRCEDCAAEVPPVESKILGRTVYFRRPLCPVCVPRPREAYERILAEQAEIEKARRARQYRGNFPLGPETLGRLAEASFDGFQARPGTEGALQAARDLAAALPRPPDGWEGLLLIGSTGTGKSHLGAAIARVAEEKGLAVAWTPGRWLRSLGALETDRREELLRLAEGADLLVLDDLGADRLTEARYGWLMGMVEERWRRRLPLVVTTNHDLDSLVHALSRGEDGQAVDGERIVSRLVDMCRVVLLEATDYRREAARQRLRVVRPGEGHP